MRHKQSQGNHLITSAIEHHAVLETCKNLGQQGFDLSILPVTAEGVVEPKPLGFFNKHFSYQ
jgi:cysteine desulfurase